MCYENLDCKCHKPNSWKTKHKFGEGNGTPLQYSCLENPMDGGAWNYVLISELMFKMTVDMVRLGLP